MKPFETWTPRLTKSAQPKVLTELEALVATQVAVIAYALIGLGICLSALTRHPGRGVVTIAVVYICLTAMLAGGLVNGVTRLYYPEQSLEIAIKTRWVLIAASLPALTVLLWWRKGL